MLYKKAFTLAEIMIVLVVIGILTAILLPAGLQSAPNENIMKFKKANTTLYRVINELVSSDTYYKDGDLGVKPNGDLIDGKHTGDYTYLCNSIADIISTKSVNCVDTNSSGHGLEWLDNDSATNNIEKLKIVFDGNCSYVLESMGREIVLADGTTFYQVNSNIPFGISIKSGLEALGNNSEGYSDTERYFKKSRENNGFKTFYKTFCIDVDGVPDTATKYNCVNECPFGYGIRADGKIITGARADAWLQKSIQEKE